MEFNLFFLILIFVLVEYPNSSIADIPPDLSNKVDNADASKGLLLNNTSLLQLDTQVKFGGETYYFLSFMFFFVPPSPFLDNIPQTTKLTMIGEQYLVNNLIKQRFSVYCFPIL